MLPKFSIAPLAAAFIAVAALALSVSGANAQSYTTRIEPRPFYGATVTLEEGVRVIRPLPPERHVIINPDNATPLALGFHETRVYENRTIRNYNYNENGSSSGSGYSEYRGRAGFYGPSFATGRSRLGRYGAGHYRMHGGGHHRGGHH